ncbi:MAG: hypothetical protein Q7W30_03625 [Coriobacteriia bacterium]|nr:hypothetical protein [Coriobacteriia bacterium]
MDDAAEPYEDPAQDDPTTTAADSQVPDAAAADREFVAHFAPQPRPEVTPRLDLDNDPFAEKQAAAEPAAAPSATPPTSDQPALELEMAPEPEPVLGIDGSLGSAAADEPLGESPAGSDDTAASSSMPAEDLSLDDMVSELSDDEPVVAGSDSEPEPVDESGAPDDVSVAGGSWRDQLDDARVEAPALARHRLSSRLPFWIYGAAWALFLGVMTYLLWPAFSVDAPLYPVLVFGGAAMSAVGVILGIVVLVASRAGSTDDERAGLTRAVALRTAGWMAVGVVLWWVAMFVLDLHRTGILG